MEEVKSKPTQSFDPIHLWAWIAIAWALYRYFIKLSEPVDEFLIKPLIFVVPVIIYVIYKEKRKIESIGLSLNKFGLSLLVGLGFGVVFALEGILANYFKYGRIEINPANVVGQYGIPLLILMSFFTAFSEEILNRGFIFNRFYEKSNKFVSATVLSALLFVLLHVPILVTALHLKGTALVLFFVTDFILALANNSLFLYTGTLVAPILVHVFWNLTVSLFL